MPRPARHESLQPLLDLGRPVPDLLDELFAWRILPGAPDLLERRTLAENLVLLASRPTAPGIRLHSLVVDLLREVSDPVAVVQGSRQTCAAATVQMLLAARAPAEYVRLVRGLAASHGRVRFASGSVLRRCPGTERADDSGRSPASRLVQAAFMDFANAADRYHPARDKSDRRHGPSYTGLFTDQSDRLLEAATARRWDSWEVGDPPGTQAMRDIGEAISAGELVPVALFTDEIRHAYLVERMDARRVVCLNPWGRRDEFAPEDFRKRLLRYSVPAPGRIGEPPQFFGLPGAPLVVRLRTFRPHFPATCPGCGGRAREILVVPHEYGAAEVPVCSGCAGRRARAAIPIAGVALAAAILAMMTSATIPELRSFSLLLPVGSVVGVAWVLGAFQPGVVEARRVHRDPPLLELTAVNPRWLSELSRLNPGSTRNFLERW
ncbi:MAG: hypothetical protein HYY18_11505 [Planctomycetes bacterium]|nr:hypothetical protein [Planctomycetota bacterium]